MRDVGGGVMMAGVTVEVPVAFVFSRVEEEETGDVEEGKGLTSWAKFFIGSEVIVELVVSMIDLPLFCPLFAVHLAVVVVENFAPILEWKLNL
ncbi:hypothetical protein COLO4_07823 [Corchorus olitorius]|uniref:Uncharacterized protein n=1 Tax=Corchorus olitorius TaxID=93759 RepID=A0A1R3KIH5_9ROSI|nr:hypothetical protein COLO4_07823 [Corchorus olitorius]